MTTTDTALIEAEAKIRAAYAKLDKGRGYEVRLVEIADICGVTGSRFTRTLKHMATLEDVALRAMADQKLMTIEDQIGAILLGGTKRHMIQISR